MKMFALMNKRYDQNIECILAHGSPNTLLFAAERDKRFVDVPDFPESALSPPECAGV